MTARTFTQHLLEIAESDHAKPGYTQILSAVAVSAKYAAAIVSRGVLALGPASLSSPPSPQVANRGLRRLVTEALTTQSAYIKQLAAISFARSDTIVPVSPEGRYLLTFEALHGMRNIGDNLPLGSIFSVMERESCDEACGPRDFLQPGSRQIAAGIAMYGPRTMLVVTTGHGVDGFTLDSGVGSFMLTDPGMSIPTDAAVFAIDPADATHWPAAAKRYVEECLEGDQGPRGRNYTMRWNASVLVGAFRVLNRGGLFLVPDTDKPEKWLAPLLHTAAPLAFLSEQAGGRASTGLQRVLDTVPEALTSCTPLFFGSAAEVARIDRYFSESAQDHDHSSYPLFHNRSLFAD